MPVDLVDNQFAILEEPASDEATTLDGSLPLDDLFGEF